MCTIDDCDDNHGEIDVLFSEQVVYTKTKSPLFEGGGGGCSLFGIVYSKKKEETRI
jgi:hypothetical protein